MSQNTAPLATAANRQPTAGLPQIGRGNRQSAPVFDEESQEQHLVGEEEDEEQGDEEDQGQPEDQYEQEEEDSNRYVPPQQPPEKAQAARPDKLPRIEPLFPEPRETKQVTDTSSKEAKLPRGFESDKQFEKYKETLTEYDRSRYEQLLEKNKTLKEELRKIAKQTEDVIRREK